MTGSFERELDGHLHDAALPALAGHRHFDVCGSTNDLALTWLRESPPAADRSLVTADAQSGGRGRLGRVWLSPPRSGIYASYILRPGRISANIGAMGLVVGVALSDALLELHPSLELGLKWPNDLLVGGRKLGGILCEARWLGSAPELVIGFGINLEPWSAAEIAADAQTAAVAGLRADLRTAIGGHGASDGPSRGRLLAACVGALDRRCREFWQRGFDAVRSVYLERWVLSGRCVHLDRGSTPDQPGVDRSPVRDGARRVLGLDDDGALLLEASGGSGVERIQSADVWLAPPGR